MDMSLRRQLMVCFMGLMAMMFLEIGRAHV